MCIWRILVANGLTIQNILTEYPEFASGLSPCSENCCGRSRFLKRLPPGVITGVIPTMSHQLLLMIRLLCIVAHSLSARSLNQKVDAFHCPSRLDSFMIRATLTNVSQYYISLIDFKAFAFVLFYADVSLPSYIPIIVWCSVPQSGPKSPCAGQANDRSKSISSLLFDRPARLPMRDLSQLSSKHSPQYVARQEASSKGHSPLPWERPARLPTIDLPGISRFIDVRPCCCIKITNTSILLWFSREFWK